DGKGFAPGSSRGKIHCCKKPRDIFTLAKKVAMVSQMGFVNPLRKLFVLPGNTHAAQHEVNVGLYFVQTRRSTNEIVVVLMRVETRDHPNEQSIRWNPQLCTQPCPGGRVRFCLLQIEAIRDDF